MADSKPLVILLPPVSTANVHLEWPHFYQEFLHLAVEQGTSIDEIQGACAAFLTAAEHITIFGPASLPIIPARPAPLPGHATADQQRLYERNLETYLNYDSIVTMLRRQFNAAVPKTFWSHLTPPANTLMVTLQQKVHYMNTKYAAIPCGILEKKINALSLPTDEPLQTLLQECRTFFRAAPTTPEATKIKIIKDALKLRPEFAAAFSDYFKANLHIQTFEGLFDILEIHDQLNLQLRPD